MKRVTAAGAVALTLAATLITGCSAKPKPKCDSGTVMFFGSDGYYHYGSPSGSKVPDASVPKSAQTAPGYKGPTAAPAPAKPVTPPKVDTNKAPVKPAVPAPKPATGKR